MENTFTTLSSKGQVVIPAQVREKLGIEAGTRMAVRIERDHLVLQPVTADFIDRIAGSYKGRKSLVAAREREHRIE